MQSGSSTPAASDRLAWGMQSGGPGGAKARAAQQSRARSTSRIQPGASPAEVHSVKTSNAIEATEFLQDARSNAKAAAE
eukprot:4248823-Amphidinium_carterae.1